LPNVFIEIFETMYRDMAIQNPVSSDFFTACQQARIEPILAIVHCLVCHLLPGQRSVTCLSSISAVCAIQPGRPLAIQATT
jgi:hypothetical protein